MTAPTPTILTFHGSGSNALIHTVQLARLTKHLNTTFNTIHLDAPFPSTAGPGVLPFFEGCDPYFRWVPTSAPPLSIANLGARRTDAVMPAETQAVVREAVERVRMGGGKVVGVVGFSQGTRVAGGLMRARQVLERMRAEGVDGEGLAELEWLSDLEFAVCVCDSYPPVLLPAALVALLGSEAVGDEKRERWTGEKVKLPVLHVLGKMDEWVDVGRTMAEREFEVGVGMSVVMESKVGHQYPVDPAETEAMWEWIMGVWEEGKKKEKGNGVEIRDGA